MITLTIEPVAPLLARLFIEAEGSKAHAFDLLDRMPRAEIGRIMRSRTDYLAFYGQMKDVAMPVSPETGRLLYMLSRGTGARSIVEFGTSFGISTLHLAAALRDNGGGRIVASEFEPSKVARARGNLAAAGLADLVELREGDALTTLATDLPETVDLLLLDGAKALYPDILDLVEPHLHPGAVVVADNAGSCPPYLARMREAGGGYLSMPVGGDVELSIRL